MRPTEKKPCVHRWKIEPVTGPTSKGRCSKCHRVRVFNNYLDPNLCKEMLLTVVIGQARL